MPERAPVTPPASWTAYDYAVVRVVPHVHRCAFANVGVVLHARQAGYLGIRLHTDPDALEAACGGVDVDLLGRFLNAYERIAAGGPAAGPIGLLPPSERFHWLTAPRSAVVQCSDVHGGRTADPAATLEALFAECATLAPAPAGGQTR